MVSAEYLNVYALETDVLMILEEWLCTCCRGVSTYTGMEERTPGISNVSKTTQENILLLQKQTGCRSFCTCSLSINWERHQRRGLENELTIDYSVQRNYSMWKSGYIWLCGWILGKQFTFNGKCKASKVTQPFTMETFVAYKLFSQVTQLVFQRGPNEHSWM